MADVGLINKILSMNEKHGKRGKWIGLFYLTLSDTSADIDTIHIRNEGSFLLFPVDVGSTLW